jgi:hypothetical protein
VAVLARAGVVETHKRVEVPLQYSGPALSLLSCTCWVMHGSARTPFFALSHAVTDAMRHFVLQVAVTGVLHALGILRLHKASAVRSSRMHARMLAKRMLTYVCAMYTFRRLTRHHQTAINLNPVPSPITHLTLAKAVVPT